MLQTCVLNYHTYDLWPLQGDTEKQRTKLFATALRSPATVHHLLSVRLAGYPFRVFALLDDDFRTLASAKSMLETPQCLLDPLTKHLFEQYSTPEALCSNDDFLQTLSAIAFLLIGTTFSTERTHSSNSRRAKAAAQTNVKPVEALALAHVAKTRPLWLQTKPEEEFLPRKIGRPRKQSGQLHAVENAQDNNNALAGNIGETHEVLHPKQRRGGGGAWRAYIHHQVHVLNQRADFKALAEEYRSLSPEELQWYRAMGCQGTAHRISSHKF
eukprot:5504964-Amphidinium_carterae.8